VEDGFRQHSSHAEHLIAPMSDIELAVTRAKGLEALLEQALGATGKGLHEKISSVQDRLPPPLVKQLRFIATIRNKIVHEVSYQQVDDRAGFLRACDEAEATLRALLQPVRGRGCLGLILLLAVSLAAGSFVLQTLISS
jgi:hypothetical protein